VPWRTLTWTDSGTSPCRRSIAAASAAMSASVRPLINDTTRSLATERTPRTRLAARSAASLPA
jgi:hypothetical protein